jgi:hypothetical protein
MGIALNDTITYICRLLDFNVTSDARAWISLPGDRAPLGVFI